MALTTHDARPDADPGGRHPEPPRQIPAEAYEQTHQVNARLDELLPWRKTRLCDWAGE